MKTTWCFGITVVFCLIAGFRQLLLLTGYLQVLQHPAKQSRLKVARLLINRYSLEHE